MYPTSQAKTRPVTELVHAIIPRSVPYLAIVAISERKHEVIPRAIKLLAEKPLFRAKSPKFKASLVFQYQKGGFLTLQLLDESVHGNTMLAQPIQ